MALSFQSVSMHTSHMLNGQKGQKVQFPVIIAGS